MIMNGLLESTIMPVYLKEHFPFYWRMYSLMFMKACGFSMTVSFPTIHVKIILWAHGLAVGGLVVWPSYSADLNLLDFFLWECMKENSYAVEIKDHHDLMVTP
jgi:hypothetical protein